MTRTIIEDYGKEEEGEIPGSEERRSAKKNPNSTDEGTNVALRKRKEVKGGRARAH